MKSEETSEKRVQYFDYRLVGSLEQISAGETGHPVTVNCLNPHSFITATRDEEFHNALKESDFLLPDGEGICYTLRKWRGIEVKKIAGDDLHRYLLAKMAEQGGKVYYLGSTEEVLRRIAERVGKEYPTVEVRTWTPSFCERLSETESREIIADIERFAPNVLLVSMTAPKQEKWVYEWATLRGELRSPQVIASIGAVFDFYAETVKRAPQWAVRMKVEWLVRLLKEPRRMWRRNFVSTPQFLRWVRRHRCEMGGAE